MANIQLWSTTASNNASADGDIGWAEGQAPSTVNDSARQMMRAVANWHKDTNGTLFINGTATTWAVTTNSNHSSLTDGIRFRGKVQLVSTGAVTLSLDGLTAKPVRKIASAEIVAGDLPAGCIIDVMYVAGADEFRILDVPKRALDIPVTAISGISGSTVQAVLETLGAALVPAGTVVDFAGTDAPSGWLLCYGQAVSRSTYASLFTAIGTTYGTGDGSTTFNLPDARGRVSAGKDDMGGSSANRLTNQSGGLNGDTLGATGGSETHTLTTAQLASHSHTGSTASGGSHDHTYLVPDTDASLASGGFYTGVKVFDSGTNATTSSHGGHTHTVTVDAAGSGSAHNNVQPTIIFSKIIKT